MVLLLLFLWDFMFPLALSSVQLWITHYVVTYLCIHALRRPRRLTKLPLQLSQLFQKTHTELRTILCSTPPQNTICFMVEVSSRWTMLYCRRWRTLAYFRFTEKQWQFSEQCLQLHAAGLSQAYSYSTSLDIASALCSRITVMTKGLPVDRDLSEFSRVHIPHTLFKMHFNISLSTTRSLK
jgi:hypothetical protein